MDDAGAMISRQPDEQAVSPGHAELDAQRLNARRLVMLYVLFLLLSFGLGYPTLNRYDPTRVSGLADVKSYVAMVTRAASVPGQPHMRFRVLVPWMARPFYSLARGRVGSWDPVMFGLLSADSIFVAGTALLIVVLGTRVLGSYPASLIASLLYLANFAVPNLRLVGLVDAGEAFFLLALYYALATKRLFDAAIHRNPRCEREGIVHSLQHRLHGRMVDRSTQTLALIRTNSHLDLRGLAA